MIKVSNLILQVFKGNPKAHFVMTLDVLFWDLKGTVPSPSKVTIGSHSHIIRIRRFERVATRLYIAGNLKFRVRSQSHKRGCLCVINSNRRICEFGAARDCVSKYYKR